MAGEFVLTWAGGSAQSRGARKVALLSIVVIAVLAAASAFLLATSHRWKRDPLNALMVATEKHRTIEARLGGFPWGPLHARTQPTVERSSLRLAAASGELLAHAESGNSAEAHHEAGVAYLLTGRTRQSLTRISAAARSSNDPRHWNDLAAALYEAAVGLNAPELLAEALAAADSALAGQAEMPEALFNRALALQRLGLRDSAREAWDRYLSVDSASEWADEVRQHRTRLAAPRQFKEILERDFDSLVGHPRATAALAREFTQQSRTFGEARILGRWGAEESRGNTKEAERHLRLARALGAEVRRINRDAMLDRSVAAIDAAGEPQRRALATAHVELSQAHDAFNGSRYVDAESKFRAAASNFERGGSPLALVARYYSANAVFEQGRLLEARTILDFILATAPPEFAALRAQVLWEIGLCHASAARWGDMLRAIHESVALFERLGETAHAAAMHSMLAWTYDRIGDRESAWKHRMVALRDLGKNTNFRLQNAIGAVAQAAMLEQKWRIAASFLNLEVEIGRRGENAMASADGLLIRAAVRRRLDDRAGAGKDLSDAAAIIAGIQDTAANARIGAKYAVVQAMLAASAPEAIALLSKAIEYQSNKGYRVFLPNLFLQRARAYRESGNVVLAAADVEQGIDELETHRQSLPENEQRWGVFHGADDLFAEGIDLALRRDDTPNAFEIAERARARSLLDTYVQVPSLRTAQIRPGTTIVEYAQLPSTLVIFTLNASGISAVEVPSDDASLAERATQFVAALRDNDQQRVRAVGGALYRTLIEPVAAKLAGSAEVAFVVDGALAAIPFGALVDPAGRYLLERHVIVVAPSASVFAAAAERRLRNGTPERVLIVTRSAPAAGFEILAFVKREADAIARSYKNAVRLDNDDARPEALMREAAAGGAIHFAGHAIGDEGGFESASIVLSDGRGGERHVSTPEIAALRLRRTSVVVLAGCSTAVGERRSAEGALSVAHGFLAAGSPSVIATLWPIDDQAAADFFPRLHTHLAAGRSPAEALREAQLEMLRQPSASTALWAAIQTIGS